jgi:two-component system, chemotaxis family, protein-glutamate methylesterase/glutaminase
VSKHLLKVLVVDDSAFMRLLISDLLTEGGIEVVGTAVNGLEAVERTKELAPDVVLLDLNMPEYDGLYGVKGIMSECPTPILILSSVGNSNLEPVFDALKNGAVDYMNKPDRNKSKMREIQSSLITKVKSTSRAKPKSLSNLTPDKSSFITTRNKKKKNTEIIAIGASTGGPSAIEQIISSLPEDFDIPLIICQHMPSVFIPPFVNRLGALTGLHVVSGSLNMRPTPGTIIFCPGHANMILKKQDGEIVIDFTEEKFVEYNNPSINAMMESVAKIYESKSVGVLLTGMGKDGVNGMKAIKEIGGFTIAQDKESSVIYGMPKVAVERGVVDISLNIKEIGSYLVNDLK